MQDGTAQTDGTIKLIGSDGTITDIPLFIAKGKLDWGEGGGGNPVMQLCAYHAAALADHWDTAAVADSFFPTIGLEVFGHGFRYDSKTQQLASSLKLSLWLFFHQEMP